MEEKNIPRELVESLQNGEREELDKIYKQLKRETYSKDKRYNEKGEDLWGDEWAQNDEYHARIYNEGLRDMKNMAMDLLSQSKKEAYNEGYMECSEDDRFIEHYEVCKKNGIDTVTMAKEAKRIKDKIDTIISDITDKAELESLTNQKKDI